MLSFLFPFLFLPIYIINLKKIIFIFQKLFSLSYYVNIAMSILILSVSHILEMCFEIAFEMITNSVIFNNFNHLTFTFLCFLYFK